MVRSSFQKWYPPAETKIPLSLFIAAFFSHEDNFKDKLCEYLGVEHCILGSSGRALLSELLYHLKESAQGKKDEVLIPGYTCYSVAASVAKAGLKISVYDIDPLSYYPDIVSLNKQISEKTLAVVVQHLFGIPTQMDEILSVSRDYGSMVIEDAAQGLGGRSKGLCLGTQGDYGLFSFGRGKPLPLGSGGAMVGKDKHILGKMRLQHSKEKACTELVKTASATVLSHPRIYGIMEFLPLGLGETIFDPDFDLLSMGNSLQKLGTHALGSLDDFNTHRQMIARLYRKKIVKGHIAPVREENQPVYPRFPILAGTTNIPSSLVRLGVRRMYPKAIIDEPIIRSYLADKGYKTPGAREISQKLITLPTHTRISGSIAYNIATQVNTYYKTA